MSSYGNRLLAGLLAGALGAWTGCGSDDGGHNSDPLLDPGAMQIRAIDGAGNNLAHPSWGQAGTQLRRRAAASYADGISEPSAPDGPNPRAVSNALNAQSELFPNSAGASDFLWQWGQFVDHDLDLSDTGFPAEAFDIPVPAGDPVFDPNGTGGAVILLNRSIYDLSTGTDSSNPRQQLNLLTAYIDASNVYGSDAIREAALRAADGSGRLKTSPGDLLPFNTFGLPNLGGPGSNLFLAGDIRSNEQASLTAMHTLWVREHNRLADELRGKEPGLSGDEIYGRARAVVGALMQVITYNEFLPLLIGPDALRPYEGYDSSVNAGIETTFSTASYRLGHTLLSPTIQRLQADGTSIPQGPMRLRDAFLSPQRILDDGGIEPILRGLASQRAQRVDLLVIDDVRNFLVLDFPGGIRLDLPSLNIQRGRDHGLPDYNSIRAAYGLARVTSFAEITSDTERQAALEAVYGDVDSIDPWIGGLGEDTRPPSMFGELITTVLTDQFERLRDGDRFWYQNVFSASAVRELERTRLSDVIRRNTSIGSELQDDAFRVP